VVWLKGQFAYDGTFCSPMKWHCRAILLYLLTSPFSPQK